MSETLLILHPGEFPIGNKIYKILTPHPKGMRPEEIVEEMWERKTYDLFINKVIKEVSDEIKDRLWIESQKEIQKEKDRPGNMII